MTHNYAQGSLNFDLNEGERRKEEGLALAALSRKQLLELARLCAVRIARERGVVSFDDVFFAMVEEGIDPLPLGNAAGCVFRGKQFVFTGHWEKSRRVSNHARVNRVWRLASDQPATKGVISIMRPQIVGSEKAS